MEAVLQGVLSPEEGIHSRQFDIGTPSPRIWPFSYHKGGDRRAAHAHGGLAGRALVVEFTEYFLVMRDRPDRSDIRLEWIERAVRSPDREQIQADGRIRRWVIIPEAGGRFLRVVLLPDGRTVHNAFFDRTYKP